VAGAIGFQIINEHFSGKILPSFNEGDEKKGIGRNSWKRFFGKIRKISSRDLIKYPLIHALGVWISLSLAYNSYKEWMRNVAGTPITPDIKSTIKAAFPWTILLFVAIYLVITVWRNRKIGYLSFKQYVIVFAIQAVLINTIFYSNGTGILIVQNLSLPFLALLMFAWFMAIKFIIIDPQRSILENIKANPWFARFLRWMEKPYFPPLAAFITVFGILFCFILYTLYKDRHIEMSYLMKPFFLPSIVLGIGIAVLVLIAAAAICLHYRKTGRGLYGLIALGILELWWAVPRGYGHEWLLLKAIPLIIGASVVLTMVFEKWRLATIGTILFFISFAWLDFKSPYGFPDRYDPFSPAPYVDFLKKQDNNYRVMGGYGILYPNFASAAGIQDVRYINSMSIETFHEYRKHLQIGDIEQEHSTSLWFTGKPYINMKKKSESLTYSMVEDFKANLNYYSFLGVK
jgi:hypothetical protein